MDNTPVHSNVAANRIITIIFFLLISYSAYQAWGALAEIALAAVKSKLSFATHVQQVKTLAEDKQATSAQQKEKRRAIMPQETASKDEKLKAWPQIAPMEKISDKLKQFLVQAKSANNSRKYEFFELNTFAHRILQVPGIHKAFYIFKNNNGKLFEVTASMFSPTYSTSADLFAEHVLKSQQLTIGASDILVCYAIIKPMVLDGISQDWLKVAQRPILNQQRAIHLLEGKVNQISIAQQMRKENIDLEPFIFKTDHHWTPEAGFYAFTKIAQYYQKNTGLHVPSNYLDIAHYKKEYFRNAFLGSYGRYVGKKWAGTDDLTLISPNFPTSFELERPFDSFKIAGDFSQCFFVRENLRESVLYESNAYATYMSGDAPLTIIKNKSAPNAKRLLIIRDSFACVLSPFLCLLFQEVHLIDPRLYKRYGKSTHEYLSKNHFDYVLYFYTPCYSRELN